MIKPKEKRHEYIQRLDQAIETLEAIINSEDADEKTRIQAANSLARLIGASYTMIVDIDVENIEAEAETLKKMIKDTEAKRGLQWDPDKNEWVPNTEKKNK